MGDASHFQLFVELKGERFLPEPGKRHLDFYTRVKYGEQDIFSLAAIIFTPEDHRQFWEQSYPTNLKEHPQQWYTHPAPVFLVREYAEDLHFNSLKLFFNQIRAGSNREEMIWKCAQAFGFADSWEWFPTLFDMQLPKLKYKLQVRELEFLEKGVKIQWSEVSDLMSLPEPVRVWIALVLEDQEINLYHDLYPLEVFYSMLDKKLQHAGQFLLCQDRTWGAENLNKAAMEAHIQLVANSFDGNTIEELLLKLGTQFNAPDMPTLLGTPLTPGGPYTLSPNPIRTDYNAVLD